MPTPLDSGPLSGRPQATRPLSLALSTPDESDEPAQVVPPDGMADPNASIETTEIRQRVLALGLDPITKERVSYFLLERSCRGIKTLGRLEAIIELLPNKIPEIGLWEWAHICQTVLPEIYGEPPPSFKASHSVPGSKSRIWRLAERWRLGYQLFHPRDSLGVRYDSLQLSMFDEKIEPHGG